MANAIPTEDIFLTDIIG